MGNKQNVIASLCEASINGDAEKVKKIVPKVKSLDITNETGKNALHLACQHGHNEVVSILLTAKASINKKDDRLGNRPLHYACATRSIETLKILIGTDKIEIDSKDEKGWTAAHTCASSGNVDCLCLLLKNKANINSQSHRGDSLLYRAAFGLHIECIKILLEAKADANIMNTNGQIPMDCVKVVTSNERQTKLREQAMTLLASYTTTTSTSITTTTTTTSTTSTTTITTTTTTTAVTTTTTTTTEGCGGIRTLHGMNVSTSRFLNLPGEIVASILSFLTKQLSNICKFSIVCRDLERILAGKSLWESLLPIAWSDTGRRPHWPKISSRQKLYYVLEKWSPREGLYQLTNCFPWGMLVLARFKKGQFIGELLNPAYILDTNSFSDNRVRVFTVTFLDGEILEEKVEWCETVSSGVTQVDISDYSKQKVGALSLLNYFDWGQYFQHRKKLAPYWINTAFFLQINFNNSKKRKMYNPNTLWDKSQEQNLIPMLQALLKIEPYCIELAFVNGPFSKAPRQYIIPKHGAYHLIRPGLYVGNYSEVHYGQFRYETLLLEYFKYDLKDGNTSIWKQIVDDLFKQRTNTKKIVEQLKKNYTGKAESLIFLRGTKLTGDCHVPMGQVSFVAIVYPESEIRIPEYVRDSNTKKNVSVLGAWRGWGTLSYQGFNSPSWDNGKLFKLDSSADSAFAFSWDSGNNDPTILHRVKVQENEPRWAKNPNEK